MSNPVRLVENAESLSRRLSEIDEMITLVERSPAQDSFRSVALLMNEFEVMLQFFHRADVVVRFNSLKTRALNVSIDQNGLLLRAVNPDPFEVPEIRDFKTKGLFTCDRCGNNKDIVVRISTVPRPIKTIYKCLACGHTQLHMVLPSMAAAVMKTGKELKFDDIPLRKRKEDEI